jgi:hypothetical protein
MARTTEMRAHSRNDFRYALIAATGPKADSPHLAREIGKAAIPYALRLPK